MTLVDISCTTGSCSAVAFSLYVLSGRVTSRSLRTGDYAYSEDVASLTTHSCNTHIDHYHHIPLTLWSAPHRLHLCVPKHTKFVGGAEEVADVDQDSES